jgi:Polyhydroxyalkanoic acid inclusion protein (PhaP_Bmeg)
MAQKKMETVPEVEEKVTPEEKGPFVTTFWDQYEQSRERSEKLRESREDAYLTAIREVIKFNKQYRKSLVKLYDQTKKTNKEVVSEVVHQLNARKEEAKEEAVPVNANDRDELKTQLKEVSGQLEKLAITPIKSFVQVVEQLEENFEKNTESNIAFARERRKAWLEVRKEYVKLARDTHLNLVERSKNSLKELVKTR